MSATLARVAVLGDAATHVAFVRMPGPSPLFGAERAGHVRFERPFDVAEQGRWGIARLTEAGAAELARYVEGVRRDAADQVRGQLRLL